MFDTLVESKARRRTRLGGSFISVAVHAVLVAAAVYVTAEAQNVAPEDVAERISPMMHAAPQQPAQPSESQSSSPAPVGVPSLAAPSVIPIDIPAITLSSDLTDAMVERLGGSPRGLPAGIAHGMPGGKPVIALAPGGAFEAEQVDKPVVLRPGSPVPGYPNGLQAAGVSGIVVAEFVVDTLGRVDVATVRIRSTDHEQFSGSVRVTLPKLHFLPAELGGRKVPQRVLLPFRFDITP